MGFLTSPITIDNNIWIGANTLILIETIIGDNYMVVGESVIWGDYLANMLLYKKVK